jgi:hypothetical protein
MDAFSTTPSTNPQGVQFGQSGMDGQSLLLWAEQLCVTF